jgi:hypothetical protein
MRLFTNSLNSLGRRESRIFFSLAIGLLFSCAAASSCSQATTQSNQGSRVTSADQEAAATCFKDLIAAMKRQDENAIASFTTKQGLDSLFRRSQNDTRYEKLATMASHWEKCDWRWKTSSQAGQVKLSLGPEYKEQTIVFVKSHDGWRVNEFFPGK